MNSENLDKMAAAFMLLDIKYLTQQSTPDSTYNSKTVVLRTSNTI